MAEHPIIFTTEMVKAILDGRKTQTRRVIDPQPYETEMFPVIVCIDVQSPSGFTFASDRFDDRRIKPKYKVGDMLWVRESWGFYGTGWSSQEPNQETIYVGYKADNTRRDIVLPYDIEKGELCNGLKTPGQINPFNPYGEITERKAYLDWQEKWWAKQKNKSARFMFRWAARIFLEITGLRVERVQDISEEVVKAEGVKPMTWINHPEHKPCYKVMFQPLWDSINNKRGYGWDKNPWVWAIEFRVAPAERSIKGGDAL